jgi:uncharacterized membrane protein
MRNLIIYIICGALFFSCASRKVNIVKEETKTKIDSTSIVKTDSVSILNNNIKIVENSEEFEIKPLVDSLPLVINGKSYLNSILRYKKQNKVLVDTSNKIVSKKALKQVYKTKTETKNTKIKSVDKKQNYFVYLWLLLIPVGIAFYRELRNKLLL